MMQLLSAGVVTIGASASLSLIAKATAVTAFAILAGWVARRQRAAVRHLIFVGAFAVLALLPAATAVIPPVRIPVRLLPTPAAAEAARVTPLDRIDDVVLVPSGRPWDSRASYRSWPALSTFTLLAAVWVAGVICCLVHLTVGLWQIQRVRRDGLPWSEAQTLTNNLARRAGFHRRIDVTMHEAMVSPMTCGSVRPVIVFPLEARRWEHVDVRRALIHEIEHVRRGDWVVFCLARIVCAVYWFHPLVWTVNRQLCTNAERACDDAVLRGDHAIGYADQLVALAERSLAHRRRPLVAMANRRDLSRRVHALLSMRQQRGPAGRVARTTVAVAAVASVVALAPLRPVATAAGQTTAGRQIPVETTARPQFEVASIRAFTGDGGPLPGIMSVRPLPGGLTADATLQVLMQYAYGVQYFQIVGGPSWLNATRYQISAKADGTVNPNQLFLMLQSLLEERFQLKVHRETRELPVYALVPIGAGPKLPAPKEGVCAESAADAAPEWVGRGRMPFPGELAPARSRCGSATAAVGRTGGEIRGGRIAMSELVRILSALMGRTVRDETGFTSLFDLQLDFLPDDTTPAIPPPPPGAGITGVSIEQAIRQQLGLRLQSTRGPVEVIAIDGVEPPSPN